MRLLPASHRQQRQTSDCLAACVAMVLDYLRISYNYDNLLRVLRVDEAGAALSNVRHLHQLGLKVELRTGELADLELHLQRGIPTIGKVAWLFCRRFGTPSIQKVCCALPKSPFQ